MEKNKKMEKVKFKNVIKEGKEDKDGERGGSGEGMRMRRRRIKRGRRRKRRPRASNGQRYRLVIRSLWELKMCTAGQRVLLTITGPGPTFLKYSNLGRVADSKVL